MVRCTSFRDHLLLQIAGVAAMMLVLTACNAPQKMHASGYTQGTTYSVTYFNDGTDLQYQIDSLLLAFDRVLSTYQESSYISKWNRNEAKGDQPAMFRTVVQKAIEVSKATQGALDITVSPLMSYWFEQDWNTAQVDPYKVDSLLQHVGMDKLHCDAQQCAKSDEQVQLDVNAIAQGYAVDVLSDFLLEQGAKDHLVELGGEIRARGRKPDGSTWMVGIDSPRSNEQQRELALSVALEDRALATSGNYRKFVVIDGQKFGHTLDPRTGYPAKTDVLSATVLASDCMTADAYATALMVLGVEQAKECIVSSPDLDAILIYSEPDGAMLIWDSRENGQAASSGF